MRMRFLLTLLMLSSSGYALSAQIHSGTGEQRRTSFVEAINQYASPWVAENHILLIDSRFAKLKLNSGVELGTRYAGEILEMPASPKRVLLSAPEAESCVADVKRCATGDKLLLRVTGVSEANGVITASFALIYYPGPVPPDKNGTLLYTFGAIGTMDLVRESTGWRVTGARYNTIG
jgi:hypothetical protein